MPTREWTLVTVTFNSGHVLADAWSTVDLQDLRWIVVDNASQDDSVEVARDLGAEAIRLDRNRGFSAGNNIGLARTTTKWVGFVNPDLTVADPRDLDSLAAVSLANDGALVAPQLLYPDGTEQPNARGLPYLADKIAHRGVRLPGAQLDQYARTGLTGPTYVAWVMGAAVVGMTDVWRRLGGWDERYIAYYEDHELGLCAWEHGVPVVLDPDVRWVHQWARATTRLDARSWRHEARSAAIFYRHRRGLLSRGAGSSSPAEALHGLLWTDARRAPS